MTYHFRQHIDQMKLGEFPGAAVPHQVLNDFCEWKICIYSCFAPSAGLEWVSP